MQTLKKLTRCLDAPLSLVVVSLALAGCATVPPGAGTNPADPFEVYNRNMFEFNDRVDRALLKPIAQVYEAALPQGVRDCIGGIFANIGELPTSVNNLIQGKPGQAASDLGRFVVNSTFGLGGCFDMASRAGLQKHNEDFGQTLGRWGLQSGPYFVLPLLGPSSIRDSVGRAVDIGLTDPLDYVNDVPTRNSMAGTRLVDTRASLLPAEKVLESAALDKYQFVRDGYLQRRRSLVYDGNPPPEPDPYGEDEDQPEAAPKR